VTAATTTRLLPPTTTRQRAPKRSHNPCRTIRTTTTVPPPTYDDGAQKITDSPPAPAHYDNRGRIRETPAEAQDHRRATRPTRANHENRPTVVGRRGFRPKIRHRRSTNSHAGGATSGVSGEGLSRGGTVAVWWEFHSGSCSVKSLLTPTGGFTHKRSPAPSHAPSAGQHHVVLRGQIRMAIPRDLPCGHRFRAPRVDQMQSRWPSESELSRPGSADWMILAGHPPMATMLADRLLRPPRVRSSDQRRG